MDLRSRRYSRGASGNAAAVRFYKRKAGHALNVKDPKKVTKMDARSWRTGDDASPCTVTTDGLLLSRWRFPTAV